MSFAARRATPIEYSPTVDNQDVREHGIFPESATAAPKEVEPEIEDILPYDTNVMYSAVMTTILFGSVTRTLSVGGIAVVLSSNEALVDFRTVACADLDDDIGDEEPPDPPDAR